MEYENVNQERIALIANRASSSINTFIGEFPDVTVYDLIEYVKFFEIYGAKVIAGNALKDGKRANVRTVMTDVHASALESLDALVPGNPELADDYVWDEPQPEVEVVSEEEAQMTEPITIDNESTE